MYDVTWVRILSPSATEVLAPVAGHPGEGEAAHHDPGDLPPALGLPERLVVGAQLVERRAADASPPAELA